MSVGRFERKPLGQVPLGAGEWGTMEQESFWKIRGYRAHLRMPAFSAKVDLLQPQQGLFDLQVSGILLTRCQLLQVLPAGYRDGVQPHELTEAYVRGTDLIATYAESPLVHVRPQIYWRALRGGGVLGGIELILSAQTSRMESQPLMWSQARWSSAGAFRLMDPEREAFEVIEARTLPSMRLDPSSGTSLVLLRPKRLAYSVAMAVFPSDFSHADLQPVGRPAGQQLRYWLFPESLEKGVIRRGRIRCWFVPRSNDVRWICQAYREFLETPIPLTA